MDMGPDRQTLGLQKRKQRIGGYSVWRIGGAYWTLEVIY
jgi:hypothetical protein